MATRYQFVDDSGETRLAGFLVPEPGGSSPSQETFTGTTTIPHGDTGAPLEWVRGAGAVLLDLTAPTAPVIAASGTYALTVVMYCSAASATGTMLGQLTAPLTFAEAMTSMDTDIGTVGAPRVSLAATFNAAALDALGLYGMQDSAADKTYQINATLVKLA